METVGPIGNFRLTYELSLAEAIEGGATNGRFQAIEFQRFELHSVVEDAGETTTEALAQNSRFRTIIERRNANATTVSIWVYPDCFDELESLKTWLHQNGFQVASWPLEYGKQISGGPNGFRTTAN
jgi:hypothetical protein